MSTAAQPAAAAPTATEIFNRLWAEKYAALAAEAQAATECRLTEAFVEGPRLVAGQLIRPITGYDLLMLEGYEHPVIAAGPIAQTTTPRQLAGFLWYQKSETRHHWFTRWAMERYIRRLEKRWVQADGKPSPEYIFDALPAVLAFIEASFADSAVPRRIDEKTGHPLPVRESGTAFLAPIVVTMAEATGWTEQHIMQLPLARLWQYLKIIRQRAEGTTGKIEHSEVARLRSLCLKDTNAELRRLAGS